MLLFCFVFFLGFCLFVLIYFLREKRNLFSASKRKKADHVAKLGEYLLSSCGFFCKEIFGAWQPESLIFVFVLTFCFYVIDQFAAYHFFLSTGN